jgi:hypothetical protein
LSRISRPASTMCPPLYYGIQEFTIETDLGDGKLDQLWRDLQTPIPGATQAFNEILLTVPRLSMKGADRLAKMPAIYEH